MKTKDVFDYILLSSIKGDLQREITGISSIKRAKPGNLIFCIKDNEHTLENVKGCTVICESYFEDDNNTYITTDDAKFWFAKIIEKFFTIQKTNHIHSTVILEGRVAIGNNVLIQAYCTIGTEGFGHVKDKNGVWNHFPQVGGVIIEDDVEIAAGTNIHRGTLDDTIIGQGTKISIQCNIGHNSIIGKNTFIAGNTNLGGKTEIGSHCFIGMGTITKPGIKIGNNTTIGMGSIVLEDIRDNCVAFGNPAKERL